MRTSNTALCLIFLVAGCGHGALSPVASGPLALRTAIAPHAASYTVIYRFQGGTDGSEPQATLAVDKSGNMYGTTTQGGDSQNDGTVFTIAPSGKKKTLYAFKGGADGSAPIGGVILDGNGNLFGTTSAGGNTSCTNGCGTVFELQKKSLKYKKKLLYSFGPPPDGSQPYYEALVEMNGALFGTTYSGGEDTENDGTVFELRPSGSGYVESVLWRFAGKKGGARPYAGLVAVKGTFYGTTDEGPNTYGTIFSVSPAGKEKVLYRFHGGTTDGFAPHAALLPLGGAFYGTTMAGGTYDAGTVFTYKSGHETILYSFESSGSTDGQIPTSTPVVEKGAIYGTTENGGGTSYGYGTVYELVPASGGKFNEMILHAFGNTPTDGLSVTAGLTPYKGSFYGVTRFGGGTKCYPTGCGTAFKIKP